MTGVEFAVVEAHWMVRTADPTRLFRFGCFGRLIPQQLSVHQVETQNVLLQVFSTSRIIRVQPVSREGCQINVPRKDSGTGSTVARDLSLPCHVFGATPRQRHVSGRCRSIAVGTSESWPVRGFQGCGCEDEQ